MIKKLKKATMLSPTALALSACNTGGGSTTTSNPTSPSTSTASINVVVVDSFKLAEDGGDGHGEKVVSVFNEHNIGNTTVTEYELNLWDDTNPITTVQQEMDPDVINTSWVVADYFAESPMVIEFNDPAAGSSLRDVLDTGLDIWNNNTTIVASAGNDSMENSASAPWAFSIFPIVVGALDDTGNIAAYSNSGSETVHYYHSGNGPDGGSGTSYSTARVAAMVSDIKEQLPGISESSVRTLLEKNSVYSLEDGKYIQKLDELTTLDASIDTRVRVEAVFELFESRNPTQEELDYWINEIDNNGLDIRQLAHDFAADGIEDNRVAPIEKMQAFYHFWLNREAEDSEIADMLASLAVTKKWGPTFDEEILDEIGPWFEYNATFNNYEELLNVDIA